MLWYIIHIVLNCKAELSIKSDLQFKTIENT